MPFHRLACFKVKNESDINVVIKAYEKLEKDQDKDGKQYITGIKSGKAMSDQRSQGYNLVAEMTFQTSEDVEYYDQRCAAHKQLKVELGPHLGGAPLILTLEM